MFFSAHHTSIPSYMNELQELLPGLVKRSELAVSSDAASSLALPSFSMHTVSLPCTFSSISGWLLL